MCDAGVVAMVRGALAGKTRTIPATIKRAMAVRDRGCRFPGCSNVIIDGHHIEHWCRGGSVEATPSETSVTSSADLGAIVRANARTQT